MTRPRTRPHGVWPRWPAGVPWLGTNYLLSAPARKTCGSETFSTKSASSCARSLRHAALWPVVGWFGCGCGTVANTSAWLVVLRQKTRRLFLLNLLTQYGHLGSILAIATIKR